MMVIADRHAYFKSLAEELESQSDRVRHLIGNRHWLSDGHHKEYLLNSLLMRHMPTNILLTRGFVADPTTPRLCSKEQDILMVDTSVQGPLFHQGGLVIALPSTVMATISVKSTMSRKTITQTVQNLNSARSVLCRSGRARPSVLCAGYFFRPTKRIARNPTSAYEMYAAAVSTFPAPQSVLGSAEHLLPGPDILCCGQNLAYRIREESEDEGSTPDSFRIQGYSCRGLATAVFIATIIDHISAARGAGMAEMPELLDNLGIEQLEPPHHSFRTWAAG